MRLQGQPKSSEDDQVGSMTFRRGYTFDFFNSIGPKPTSSVAIPETAKLKLLDRPAGCLVLLAPAFDELK